MQDMKFMGIVPCLKLQSLGSAEETPDPPKLQCAQSVKQGVKSLNGPRRQKSQGRKSVEFAPRQQFQEVALVNLTPGPEQGGERSVISPDQQCVNTEQSQRGSKSEDGKSLELIPGRKFKGGNSKPQL